MPDPALPAIVLLAHGSPDPDWRRPIEAIRDRMRELDPLRDIVDAYLEHCEPTLADVAQQLRDAGHVHAHVIAAFVSPGGNHLKHHVPQLVDEVQRQHPQLRLELHAGALGDEPEVVEAIARSTLGRVLMADD